LNSGDTLLLLSDGLPEQVNKNEEMIDYPRIKNHFNEIAKNNPDEIIKSLVSLADSWMDGAVQADDISLIVLKVV
jgi:serine phosphatase RsbU (regulator of sigma subunit)